MAFVAVRGLSMKNTQTKRTAKHNENLGALVSTVSLSVYKLMSNYCKYLRNTRKGFRMCYHHY